MILRSIRKLFSKTIYVQLSEDKIRICNIDDGLAYEEPPYIALDKTINPNIIHAIGAEAFKLKSNPKFEVSNPFSHPRLLIGSYLKAEKILMHGIREVHKNRYIRPSPLVVIHPLDKLEGGITAIECRAYRELALGAGARNVYIHVGSPLSVINFNMEQINEPICA